MLLRLLFSCVFWVVFTRWGYEEIKLMAPDSLPVIETVLQKITPNTHDKWPTVVYEETDSGMNIRLIPAEEKEDAETQTGSDTLKFSMLANELESWLEKISPS